MRYEMLVGLHVEDHEGYENYRKEMKPILSRYGGRFGYDFIVSEVLKSETEKPINRVFTISFQDEASKDGFFADESYLDVRKRFLEKSVTDTTIIAAYHQ